MTDNPEPRTQETRLRIEQLATLNDIGKTIISSLDLDTMLAVLMDRVQYALDADSASLMLMDKGKLVFHTAVGPASERVKPLALESGQGIAGWVAQTGESVLVGDAKQDVRHFSGIDQLIAYETRSLLCVPMKGPESQVIGVLEAMNPRHRPAFTQQDQELLESIATFAVIGIQNARLYRQTVDHVADLQALVEVGKAIGSTLDLRDTLQMIAAKAARLTSAARSQITLVDTLNHRVTYCVEQGDNANPELACTYEQFSQGLFGWVAQRKVSALSADVHTDERTRNVPMAELVGSDARSMIVAPLLIKGEPVGTLGAVRLQGVDPFTERELGLLDMLAGQASIAIQNAHFFEDRKRQIIELSILGQTGQALSSTLQLDDVMELIHHQVSQAMDAQDFYVALYDPEHETVSFPIAYESGLQQAGPDITTPAEEWAPRQQGHGLSEYVIRTKKPLWLSSNIQQRLTELGIDLIGAPARSWLGVPILAGDQVLGVISVQSPRQENAYDQENLELLMTIASQASAAIRNAQLFAQVQRFSETMEHLVAERTEAWAQANQELITERDRLNSLYRIMRELSVSLELERTLNRTLSLVNLAVGAEQGYILIQDTGSRSLVYRAIVGSTGPSADGAAFPSPRVGDAVDYHQDQGLIGWLVSHRELIRSDDLSTQPRWYIRPGQERWHRSLMAAPLLSGDEIRGAILLYHSAPGRFTADHQRMLDAVAPQVAVTVSSIEMFHLLSEAADRLGNMLRSQQLEAAKSQAILEGVADGVMFIDADGEIALFNAAAERILQTPRSQVLGRPEKALPGLFHLAHTSWGELTHQWRNQGASADRGTFYEERLEFQGRVVSMRVAPVTRQSYFEGMVAVFRDITKDVEVDRMKSEFVSMVSHELRTPMTSIKGYIDLLHSGMAGPINATQRQFLQTVKDNADRLTVLLNDLLEINHLDTGELNLALESVDPLDIANQVIADLMPRASEKHHQLSITASAVLPAVRADPVRLAQILTNLVSNAINYTPDGGCISLDAQVGDGFLHMHVTDNGIGIAAEDQEKLFSRFYRADHPLVQAHSGTGLGLFIVRALVQLHGGKMWFESQVGRGSTFSFSLPLAETEAEVSPRREFRTISYRSQDKHVLVVEDDVDAANLIAHQLRSRGGFRVHVARYGRDAIDYLLDTTHHVDLITLDLRLPDIHGLQVLQQIKAHESIAFIPVVIISILSEEQESHRIGARAYLSKPIEEGRLLTTIDRILAETATILVAEDDPLQAEVLQMALEDHGFLVFTEHDGREVINQVRSRHPGLVLLDIKLPGIDGYSILSTLKSAPDTRTIPVIIITGSVSDPEKKRQRVLDLGAIELFTKPLNLENLVEEIQQALGEGVREPQPRPPLPPQPAVDPVLGI